MISRRTFITSAVVGVVGTAGIGGGILASSGDEEPPSTSLDADSGATARATARVERQTLTESKEFGARVNYGEPYDLPIQREGTVTERPDVGQVIGFGEAVVWCDRRPTLLVEGSLPMYRELKRRPDVPVKGQKYMQGDDVRQLQEYLIGAGITLDGEFTDATGAFDPNTEKAVKAWQKFVGLPVTGRVDATQIVFIASPVRLHSVPRVGASFSAIRVTDPGQKLTMGVQSRDRTLVIEGAAVELTAPDGSAATGAVTKLERTTSEDGTTQTQATIVPDSALPADAQSATVTVSRTLAADVLTVPVRALLAVQEGGFAVEMAALGSDGRADLRRVEVGAVADGRAEVTGDIADGDDVVVAQ